VSKLPLLAIAILLGSASTSLAQARADTPSMFNLNTFFVIFSAILVMWMAAGFAMIEAGFVRAQGVINQCAKNMGLFAIACVGFLISGYGLLFPENWIVAGMLGQPGSVDIGTVADGSETFDKRGHSSAAIVFFQMMFAATVVSIVSGALAERMKLVPFFIFAAVLGALIYPIQASWSWGGGFLTTTFGFVDLAGSTVVHVVGGVAALTGSVILGARAGRYRNGVKVPMTSFNLPIATLGTLILWMGWFGFNAGSYLNFNTEADAANVSRILLNTNMAAAGGVIAAATVSYVRTYQFDLTFMMNGALAGLVSITAEPLYPSPGMAVAIGMGGGLVLFWAFALMDLLKIDDVVGAIPVHLFCGVFGTLVVPLTNPDATFTGQATSVAIVFAFVAVTTSILWLLLHKTIGIRISAESEFYGVDANELVMKS